MYLSFGLVSYKVLNHNVQIQKIHSISMCSYEATNSAFQTIHIIYIETPALTWISILQSKQICLIFMVAICQITNYKTLLIWHVASQSCKVFDKNKNSQGN